MRYKGDMIMKRILAILLCLMMCAGVLISCSNKEGNDTTVNTSGVETEEVKSSLPDMDWGGRVVRVGEQSSSSEPSAVFSDDMTTALGNVVFVRNAHIKDMYNIEVEVVNSSKPSDEVVKEAMAGESSVDLLIDTVSNMKGALAQGVFCDLSALKYVDLNGKGWNKDANRRLSIRHYQYVATGDLSLREKGGSYVIYCNRDKLEAISDIDIRQTVLDGKWTIELMQQLVKDATVIDTTSGGTLEYGLTNGDNIAFFNFLTTAYGLSICEKDDTDTPYFTFDNPTMYESAINAIDDLLKMYASQSTYTPRYSTTTPSALDTFIDDKALFMSNVIQRLSEVKSNVSFIYTVLPHPKYEDDGTVQYYSAKHYSWCTLVAVPYFAPDPDFSGFALQALTENSSDLTYTYVEEQCKLKGSYDEIDYQLMGYALVDVFYDLGAVYNWGAVKTWIFTDRYDDASGIQSIPVGKVNNFATLWAADKALAHLELEEFLTNFTE